METSPSSDQKTSDTVRELLWLSHELGREDRGLAILGEGNCSAKLDSETFMVKASGGSLATLQPAELTTCNTRKILALAEMQGVDGKELENGLMAARTSTDMKRPSIEAAFHAWLLSLDGVQFVGHCHPTAVNMILCSPRAEDFARQRMFPDEVVCCGVQSVLVPYSEPGMPLAREIRAKVEIHIRRNQNRPPKLILLQNHGAIAIGATVQSVLAALLMAEKAARIFLGAALLGGPLFLHTHQSQRIETRPDEIHRQRQMKM